MRPFLNTSICRKYVYILYVTCICYTSTVMKPKTGLQHVKCFDIMWHNVAQDIIKVMHTDNGMSINVQFHSSTTSFTFTQLADVFIRSDFRPETFMDKKKNTYSEYPKQQYASVTSVCCLKYYIRAGYKVLSNLKKKPYILKHFVWLGAKIKDKVDIITSRGFLHLHIWFNLYTVCKYDYN